MTPSECLRKRQNDTFGIHATDAIIGAAYGPWVLWKLAQATSALVVKNSDSYAWFAVVSPHSIPVSPHFDNNVFNMEPTWQEFVLEENLVSLQRTVEDEEKSMLYVCYSQRNGILVESQD